MPKSRISTKISWLAFKASLMSALMIFIAMGISLTILNWVNWERESKWFADNYIDQRKILLAQMVEQAYNTIEYMTFLQGNGSASEEEILRLLASMQSTFHNERYLVIMDYQGDVLMGADGYNEKRPNTHDTFVNDGQSMYDFLKESLKENPNGGFVEYFWKNTSDKTETKRLSYITECPARGWIIGAGIRLNDFEAYMERHRQTRIKNFYNQLTQFFVLSIILLAIVIFFSNIIRKKSDKSLSQLISSLQEFTSHHKELDLKKIEFEELRQLAQLINNMMNIEVQARIREEELNFNLNRYIDIIDRCVITSSTDINGRITYVSEAFCKISGYTKSELIGMPHSIMRPPDITDSIYASMWSSILKSDFKTWRGEMKNCTKDGGYYWVDTQIEPLRDMSGTCIGYIAIRQDITDKKRIEELSITDDMTGLYNRRHFNSIMEQELRRASRGTYGIHFAIFDIDRFKQLNDRYGHQKGDEVLIKVATVIKNSLRRGGDFAFRLGGEEFGVVISELGDGEIFDFIDSIRMAIGDLKIPHELNGDIGYVTVSFGLFSCSKGMGCCSSDFIYKMADKALYRAKENGRNRGEVEAHP